MKGFVVLLFAAATTATAHAQSSDRIGTVSFLVVDRSGKALDGWWVSRFETKDRNLADRFTALTATEIPPGIYEYVLKGPSLPERPGLSNWNPYLTGKVDASQPEAFVVATAPEALLRGFSISRTLPSTFVIHGRIEPNPKPSKGSDPVRLHIHPLNGYSDVDVRIDSAGEFRIYAPLSGLCVLAVLRGTEILYVQPVFFAQDFRSASFVLQMGRTPERVLRVESDPPEQPKN